ncbi:hypothetical protein DRQ26_02165 [bacterium]|nr:MAG: hypothetical protein DRQ26_02165 [bacterium]
MKMSSGLLHFLFRGKDVKEIAQELGVSQSSVRKGIQSIYRKTGIHRRLELLSLFFKIDD